MQRRFPLDGVLFQSGDICNNVAKISLWKTRFSAEIFFGEKDLQNQM